MLQGALSGLSMGADPVKVFNHVNRFLCRHAEVGRYATMFIGIIGRDGMLEYIKAGHPSPLLLRKGKVSELYTEGSFPVGLIPEAELRIRPRCNSSPTTRWCYSVTASPKPRIPNHELFEVSRPQPSSRRQGGVPVEALQESVLDSVRAFTRGAQPV